MKHLPMILAFALSIGTSVIGQADGEFALCDESQWKQATAAVEQVAVGQHGLILQHTPEGRWISKWLDAPDGERWRSIAVEAEIDLFANKTIEVIVDGSAPQHVDGSSIQVSAARRPKVLLDWRAQPPIEREGERIRDLPGGGFPALACVSGREGLRDSPSNGRATLVRRGG
jgi:hypothetical protein